MKWLFFLIVLANAAFLSWHSFVQDDAPIAVDPVYAPPVSTKIFLLSENDPDAPKEALSPAPISNENLEEVISEVVSAVVDDAPALLCPRIEIERAGDKVLVEKELAESGWQYKEQEATGKRAKFWLYIAAPENAAKAQEIVKELTAKSVDSFIINRGEMKNRISLGLYSSEDRAALSKARIEELFPYTVDIYEHMRTVSLQYIDIERPVSEKGWAEFVSRFDLNEMTIKLEKNPC
ncbi:SPOR domain-containing protein [Marinomonas sp. C2222]|uniref:SPOR domain-containing protein n=1 Tax=Marinomonas sargassi TaxID=2984494 RepID=A0ABT2YVV4_9GAMM|nr:SPOR domain-containing protein [Marinomonas sargassi]MCV2404011.1 SPOR domain-containing protein [Marinomonas sargassi]